MNLDEKKSLSNTATIQNLVLENREKLSVSGVLDVLSFDDEVVVIETELGLLNVKGEDLRINKLSIDTSEVVVEGNVYNLFYSEKNMDKKGSSLIRYKYLNKMVINWKINYTFLQYLFFVA
jgi:sporulation protein YabP